MTRDLMRVPQRGEALSFDADAAADDYMFGPTSQP